MNWLSLVHHADGDFHRESIEKMADLNRTDYQIIVRVCLVEDRIESI